MRAAEKSCGTATAGEETAHFGSPSRHRRDLDHPLVWMISASFKPEGDILSYPMSWIPRVWTFESYMKVFGGKYPFHLYYLNTISITFFTILGSTIVSSLAAYGFSRLKFPGRDKIFLLYLSAIMVPTQVTLIPRFILFNWMGLINNHLSLILPGVFNVFCIFLLRQFYIQIPSTYPKRRSWTASEFKNIVQDHLPLTKPALVTVIILQFTGHGTITRTRSSPHGKRLFTLLLGLNNFIDEFGQDYGP
jgi:multiple sugar transport system permease protein